MTDLSIQLLDQVRGEAMDVRPVRPLTHAEADLIVRSSDVFQTADARARQAILDSILSIDRALIEFAHRMVPSDPVSGAKLLEAKAPVALLANQSGAAPSAQLSVLIRQIVSQAPQAIRPLVSELLASLSSEKSGKIFDGGAPVLRTANSNPIGDQAHAFNLAVLKSTQSLAQRLLTLPFSSAATAKDPGHTSRPSAPAQTGGEAKGADGRRPSAQLGPKNSVTLLDVGHAIVTPKGGEAGAPRSGARSTASVGAEVGTPSLSGSAKASRASTGRTVPSDAAPAEAPNAANQGTTGSGTANPTGPAAAAQSLAASRALSASQLPAASASLNKIAGPVQDLAAQQESLKDIQDAVARLLTSAPSADPALGKLARVLTSVRQFLEGATPDHAAERPGDSNPLLPKPGSAPGRAAQSEPALAGKILQAMRSGLIFEIHFKPATGLKFDLLVAQLNQEGASATLIRSSQEGIARLQVPIGDGGETATPSKLTVKSGGSVEITRSAVESKSRMAPSGQAASADPTAEDSGSAAKRAGAGQARAAEELQAGREARDGAEQIRFELHDDIRRADQQNFLFVQFSAFFEAQRANFLSGGKLGDASAPSLTALRLEYKPVEVLHIVPALGAAASDSEPNAEPAPKIIDI